MCILATANKRAHDPNEALLFLVWLPHVVGNIDCSVVSLGFLCHVQYNMTIRNYSKQQFYYLPKVISVFCILGCVLQSPELARLAVGVSCTTNWRSAAAQISKQLFGAHTGKTFSRRFFCEYHSQETTPGISAMKVLTTWP